ncbi:condensin-2 complex subunit H2-like [Hibiscus syriacus]|uniref:Pectinesterase n=1 Tax=Hibiscus syriacus TaxID=106335 RepID=A0A6A2X066_HIBSY|nr:pectinesterase-like [Hibiscus syriacus]KAE8667943.1 condensin-2 complex subunit H2-like [Hibiscus syriacus]
MANNVVFVLVCLVAVVASVVAVVFAVGLNDAKKEKISTSSKAVQTVCQPTAFKETCEKSLESSSSSDPKELIRTGFQATVTEIKRVLADSKTLQELEKDKGKKNALEVCKEVLDFAIDDLEDSFNKLGEYDMSKIGDILLHIQVWLSGALTSQQTCIDSFAEENGEAAEKMKSILKTAQELNMNALGMMYGLSSIAKDLNIPSIENISTTPLQRKLLSEKNSDFPVWLSHSDRRLLQANAGSIKPNVVVAKDGSGKYDSIVKALAEVPKKNTQRFIIHVKAGVYKEQVHIIKEAEHVMLIGDGPTKTVITNDICVIRSKLRTFFTATVAVDAKHFIAKDIGFENTAGYEGEQAVALRSTGDLGVFYNCHFNGYQDTLYAHKEMQFFRDCVITGTIDFIFGDSRAVFQNCQIIVRKPGPKQNCIVLAQGKMFHNSTGGFVLHNCTISGDKDYIPVKDTNKAYLNRPWKILATAIIIQTQIDDIIAPEGYIPMLPGKGETTSYFVEFGNRGPGAKTDGRVKWSGIKKVDLNTAKTFTPGPLPQVQYMDSEYRGSMHSRLDIRPVNHRKNLRPFLLLSLLLF